MMMPKIRQLDGEQTSIARKEQQLVMRAWISEWPDIRAGQPAEPGDVAEQSVGGVATELTGVLQ